MKKIYDCIIVGAGPAGTSAAIHLKRAHLNVLIIEKKAIGGLAINANKIENYIGFPNGISGKKFVALLKKQLKTIKVPILLDEVLSIKQNNFFEVITQKKEFFAKTVIVATGTKPKKLNIPGENSLENEKIFYHISEAPIKKGYDVIIIGGGDVAFDYALTVKEKKASPIVVMRSSPKCLKLLHERALKEKIPIICNETPLEFYTQQNKIVLQTSNKNFIGDIALIAIGREPLIPDINCYNAKGLFLVGDVKGEIYRQVQISAGDGLKTAMIVEKYLRLNQLKPLLY